MGTLAQEKIRQFSATYLIKTVSECFEKIPDHRPNKCIIPFTNFLKSAFAMMHLKSDSLLAFDEERFEKVNSHNLKKLYLVKDGTVPSDTRMREVLDPVDPIELGVVPLERRFGQENQEVEPQEDRKRRPFYGVIESPNT